MKTRTGYCQYLLSSQNFLSSQINYTITNSSDHVDHLVLDEFKWFYSNSSQDRR